MHTSDFNFWMFMCLVSVFALLFTVLCTFRSKFIKRLFDILLRLMVKHTLAV